MLEVYHEKHNYCLEEGSVERLNDNILPAVDSSLSDLVLEK